MRGTLSYSRTACCTRWAQAWAADFSWRLGCRRTSPPHVNAIASAVAADAAAGGTLMGRIPTGIPTLRKGKDDALLLLQACASLFAQGAALDLPSFIPPGPRARVPAAPLAGTPFWLAEISTRVPSYVPAGPGGVLFAPIWRALESTPSSSHPGHGAGVVVVIDIFTDLDASLLSGLEAAASVFVVVRSAEAIARAMTKLSDRSIDLLVYRGDVGTLQASIKLLLQRIACHRITAITCGVADVGAASRSPAPFVMHALRDAAVWGFLKSARLEMPPTMRVQAIDLDSMDSVPSMRSAAAILVGEEVGLPANVAIVDGKVYQEHLLPIQGLPSTPPPQQTRGTAMITGGNGALGLQLASWLASRRACRSVVLISRSGRISEANRALYEQLQRVLEEAGGQVGLPHPLTPSSFPSAPPDPAFLPIRTLDPAFLSIRTLDPAFLPIRTP